MLLVTSAIAAFTLCVVPRVAAGFSLEPAGVSSITILDGNGLVVGTRVGTILAIPQFSELRAVPSRTAVRLAATDVHIITRGHYDGEVRPLQCTLVPLVLCGV